MITDYLEIFETLNLNETQIVSDNLSFADIKAMRDYSLEKEQHFRALEKETAKKIITIINDNHILKGSLEKIKNRIKRAEAENIITDRERLIDAMRESENLIFSTMNEWRTRRKYLELFMQMTLTGENNYTRDDKFILIANAIDTYIVNYGKANCNKSELVGRIYYYYKKHQKIENSFNRFIDEVVNRSERIMDIYPKNTKDKIATKLKELFKKNEGLPKRSLKRD